MKQLRLMYPINAMVDVDDDVFEKASPYVWDQIVDHGVARFFSFNDKGEKIWLHKIAARVDQKDTTIQFIRCKDRNYYNLRSSNLIVGRNRKAAQLPVGVAQKGVGFAGLVYLGRQRIWTDIVDTPEEAAILYKKLKLELMAKTTVSKHIELTSVLEGKLQKRLQTLAEEEEVIKRQLAELGSENA